MDDRERLKRLAALRDLAELAWQAEAARSAGLRRTDAEAAERIAALRRDRGAWDAAPPGRPPGAGDAWERWTDASIAGLNLTRARLRARIEAGRPDLQRAFGRKEVLKTICEEEGAKRPKV